MGSVCNDLDREIQCESDSNYMRHRSVQGMANTMFRNSTVKGIPQVAHETVTGVKKTLQEEQKKAGIGYLPRRMAAWAGEKAYNLSESILRTSYCCASRAAGGEEHLHEYTHRAVG